MNIVILMFTYVMGFIVTEPGRSFGKRFDFFVINKISYTFAEQKGFYLFFGLWMIGYGIVLYKKFQSFSITDSAKLR